MRLSGSRLDRCGWYQSERCCPRPRRRQARSGNSRSLEGIQRVFAGALRQRKKSLAERDLRFTERVLDTAAKIEDHTDRTRCILFGK
jgi:hypothetical protein